MHARKLGAALVAAVVLSSGSNVVLAGSPPLTSPQTQSFNVTLTISPECQVDTIADLNFTPVGGVGYISADLAAETTISVGCTKDTVATVALDNGNNFDGTRRMFNGTDYVGYELYTDGSYGTVWDSTNTQDVTGSGLLSSGSPALDQTLTVYGKVPAQDTGSTGAYSDIVTATVTF